MKTKIILNTASVPMLQKGDRVIVYDDPLTKRRPEGTAFLVGRVNHFTSEELQRWKVHFESDDEGVTVERFIAPPWEVITASLR